MILAGMVMAWAMIDKTLCPRIEPFSWKERFEAINAILPVVILFLLVIGSIYSGFATPTESAAVGATGALLIGLGMKRLKVDGIFESITSTIKSTGTIFIIIICATIFGYYLTMSQIPQAVVGMISAMDVNRWVIMGLLVVLYLALGCIMDQIAILLLTLPIVFPLVDALGFDAIWFGVISIVLVEIGLATPPVGLNVFIVSSVGNIPLGTAFRGSMILLVACFLSLFLFLAFPEIVLWIPNRM